MTFENMLTHLKHGEIVRRTSFNKELVIFMQYQANVSIELAMGLKLLPKNIKIMLLDTDKGINYHNQVIIYNFLTTIAIAYTFTVEDINADDWEIIDVTEHYEYK